jgi:hypothetical protein
MNRVTTATGSTRFVYDGGEIQGEYDAATGALLRRYVSGAGTDEPIVWYEGAGLSDRRWLIADERGSIAARPVQIGGTALSKSEDRQEILENLAGGGAQMPGRDHGTGPAGTSRANIFSPFDFRCRGGRAKVRALMAWDRCLECAFNANAGFTRARGRDLLRRYIPAVSKQQREIGKNRITY